jgi:predicted Zn finger-like uncharacterized protein
MYVNARCPHCQAAVVNDANVAGKVVTCPKCHQSFQMPSAVAQPMATPAYSGGSLLGPGPKNSGIAAVLSFFWTGVGQIYNGQILLGLGMMALQFVFILLCFVVIGFPLLFILWVWSIYQAYNTAEKINRGEIV